MDIVAAYRDLLQGSGIVKGTFFDDFDGFRKIDGDKASSILESFCTDFSYIMAIDVLRYINRSCFNVSKTGDSHFALVFNIIGDIEFGLFVVGIESLLIHVFGDDAAEFLSSVIQIPACEIKTGFVRNIQSQIFSDIGVD